jgi:hypothetical protein
MLDHAEMHAFSWRKIPRGHKTLLLSPAAPPATAVAAAVPVAAAIAPLPTPALDHDELVNLTKWLRELIWLAEAMAANNRPNEQDAWRFKRQHVVLENRLRKMFAGQIEILVHEMNRAYTHANALCQAEREVITIFNFSKAKTAVTRAVKRAAAGKLRNSKNGISEERAAKLLARRIAIFDLALDEQREARS